MESMTNYSTNELNMKSQLTEEPKEDMLKLNGDVNGSYEEDMDVSDDDISVKSKCVHSNGEISEIGRVPSQNGVENMDVDGDADVNNSKTGNSNSDFSAESTNNNSVSITEKKDTEINDDRSQLIEENSNHAEETSNDSETNVDKTLAKNIEKCEEDPNLEKETEDSSLNNSEAEKVEEEKDEEEAVVAKKPHEEIAKKIHIEVLEKPIERKKEALEITLVSRPRTSKIVAKPVRDEEPCEALNMCLKKDKKDAEEIIVEDVQKSLEKSFDGDDSIIELSPEKSSKKKKPPVIVATPPRRSSRNLNKTKSYTDKDIYIEELDKKSDDDVEEVIPTDPLADDTRRSPKKNTIVVNDTKRLAEIAAGNKQQRSGKKEPTLVIIDTNSLLSGKGPIPVSQATLPQMTITPTPPRNAYPILPVVPSVGMYPHQTIKVIPKPPPQPKPLILPSLTDDMYVVEAPSFIVPYVYEKPPVTSLKDYVLDLEKILKEQRAKEEKERQKKKKEDEKEVDSSSNQDDKSKKEEEAEEIENCEISDKVSSSEGDDKEKELEEEKDSKIESKEEDANIKDDLMKGSNKLEEKEAKAEKSDKSDTETDEEVKESGDEDKKRESDGVEVVSDRMKKKSDSYFDNPLGKFFMQIGVNLVQEYVQTDLLRNQKRKRDRDGKNCPPEVHMAITSLLRTLECSKENNEPFKLEMKKCSLCSFKTESALVMAHHLETPHMRNYVYRCNFCTLEVRSPHDILFHMEAVHNVRGRLERGPAFHQCPNCPFEDNQKGKLSRHLLSCSKKYKPERNQEPPLDWEPPAKIPKVRGARPNIGISSSMYPLGPRIVPNPVVPRLPGPSLPPHNLLSSRHRGRPPTILNRFIGENRGGGGGHPSNAKVISSSPLRPGNMFRPSVTNAQPHVLVPTPYQVPNNQMFQNKIAAPAGVTAKLLQQPSISITPLPRQSPAQSNPAAFAAAPQQSQFPKPGRPPGVSKATFVICEICDGYIKDLEQLRNHMQWIHKVKIHPKMIYNRPPLNCQKCQFRFFTDQGLERHLLGSHGLVTSSMQEAANRGKDGGRCPVCGRVYQWKLLNHVARDHNLALKPAHLSYKCTVCTATFGMYKQFENHVYSAHSVVAKRVMPDKKSSTPQPSTSSSSSSESLLKPLKINDEITIIPQPARAKTKSVPQPQKTSNNKYYSRFCT